MRAFLTATALTFALTLGACTPPANTADDEGAIRDLETRWNQLIAARDVAGVVDLYAEDGMIMPPGSPAAQGAAGLNQVWGGLLGMPGMKLVITPEVITVAKAGDIAIDKGTYALTTGGPEGETTDNGKYVVVWKKAGDEWKVAYDIFNSNAAPPAAAAAEPNG
jgi:uncharacterized protein (TIGR02246 family)